MRCNLADAWQLAVLWLVTSDEHEVESADGDDETSDPEHEIDPTSGQPSDSETTPASDAVGGLTDAANTRDGAHGQQRGIADEDKREHGQHRCPCALHIAGIDARERGNTEL